MKEDTKARSCVGKEVFIGTDIDAFQLAQRCLAA